MWCQPKRVLIAVLLAAGGLAAESALAATAEGPATLDDARELHRGGRLDEAAAAYREVLADPALDQESLAAATNNLCVVLDALGELAAAEAACERALELRLHSSDRLRLARTLNNLGLVLQHQGRYPEAEERFFEALEINRELGESLAQAINLSNLGAVATQAGRFQQALERQAEVIELAREHSDRPWAGEQSQIAELNRGVVLERLGAYREALEAYRGLLASARELGAEQKASILVNSGVIYRNLGDPVQAIAQFDEAEAIYRERGDRSGEAHARLNIGIARHLNLNDTSGAEASYREALSLVEQTGDRGLAIDVLCFLGRLLVSENRPDEARSRFEEALSMARASGSVEGQWVALAGLAETERAVGNLEAALGHFENAIALIEEGRVEVLASEHRASFLVDKRAVYSGAIETLVALDGGSNGALAARALEVVQQAKSRDLLDALEERRERLGRPSPGIGSPLTVDELVHRLGTDVLIEYFATRTELLMWWTEAGSIRLVSLGDPLPILAAAEKVHRALSSGSEPSGEILGWLSKALLGPVAGRSSPLRAEGGLGAVANLWIAPDRRLRYLPFEILLLGEAGTSPADQPQVRLLERARISYLPSAWALPGRLATESANEYEFGFLGFGAVASRGGGHEAWLSSLDLRPLPAARRELESVSKRLDGATRILLGDDATEGSFRAYAGRAVRVMHFATHTALTERRGEESAILLTQADSDDGLLTPSEIVEESPVAGLVVLASCTTALGTEQDGRALTTLTGAFLAVGAGSVLATLWPVDDQSTAVFMDQFYYQLSRGRTPAEALRETKLRFLGDDRWKNPAQWSGYVLIGSGRPVVERWWVPWKWLGALTLVLALAALGWRVRASKAKRMSR